MILKNKVDDQWKDAYFLIKPGEGLTDEHALKALKELNRDLGSVELSRTFGEYSIVAKVPGADPELLSKIQNEICKPGWGHLIEEVVILPIRTSMHERVPIERVDGTEPLDVVKLYRLLVQDFYDQRGWKIYFDAIPYFGQGFTPPMGCGTFYSATPMEGKIIECKVDYLAGNDTDQTFGYPHRGSVKIVHTDDPDKAVTITNEDNLSGPSGLGTNSEHYLSVLSAVGINSEHYSRVYRPLKV